MRAGETFGTNQALGGLLARCKEFYSSWKRCQGSNTV